MTINLIMMIKDNKILKVVYLNYIKSKSTVKLNLNIMMSTK